MLVDEEGLAWERGLGHLPADLRLHQPHAAARGAGEVAGRPVRPAAAAPPGDHLRDQPPLPGRRCRAASPATSGQLARMSIIEEGPDQAGAHGPPGDGRLALGQRRGGAAHRAAARRSCSPTSTRSGRRSSTTRPTASPRAAGCWPSNPGWRALITEAIGDGWITDLDRAEEARAAGRRRRRSARIFRDIKRANKERLAEIVERRERRQPRSRLDLRRAGQAHPRVQAAAAQRPPRHPLYLRIKADSSYDPVPRTYPVRRQGGPRLRDGQADHQAHQLGGRRGQPRPGHDGTAQGGLPAELPRHPGGADLSRRPTSPSRSPPPATRPRAPAT